MPCSRAASRGCIVSAAAPPAPIRAATATAPARRPARIRSSSTRLRRGWRNRIAPGLRDPYWSLKSAGWAPARRRRPSRLPGAYRIRRSEATGERTPAPAATRATPAPSTSMSDSPVNGSCPPASAAVSDRPPDDCEWLAPRTPNLAPEAWCDPGRSVAEAPATPDEAPFAAPPPAVDEPGAFGAPPVAGRPGVLTVVGVGVDGVDGVEDVPPPPFASPPPPVEPPPPPDEPPPDVEPPPADEPPCVPVAAVQSLRTHTGAFAFTGVDAETAGEIVAVPTCTTPSEPVDDWLPVEPPEPPCEEETAEPPP